MAEGDFTVAELVNPTVETISGAIAAAVVKGGGIAAMHSISTNLNTTFLITFEAAAE